MSITEELRKFAWKECPSKFLERVTGIADDIEQAHTKEIGEVADLFKDCIPLPKDADGETIHIGDELRDTIVGIVRTVEAIGDGKFVAWNKKDGRFYLYTPSDFCHVKPDSWECIIEDARTCLMSDYKTEATPSMRWKLDSDELVERCKRLAGEDA